MKREYDFPKGARGKFYRKGADVRLPIYLDTKLQARLERIARKTGAEVGDVVNQWIRREVEFIEHFSR